MCQQTFSQVCTICSHQRLNPNSICFLDSRKEIHVTIKLQTVLKIKFTIIKLINFSVTLYRTVQKLKSTGKGGAGYGEVSCHLQGSPGAEPTRTTTEIVITKSIKNATKQTTKTNQLPTQSNGPVVGSVDIQQWTSLDLQCSYSYRHYIQCS